MPLSISTAKPKSRPSRSRSDINAAPAVFPAASSGSSTALPRIASMRTTGSSIRRTLTVSPTPAMAWPRMSNPTATLATEAGAYARAITGALLHRPPHAADRRTHRPR
ncbi:hypothetical protein G6F22_020014 [Rhizopus arrhizus]|nr:hypothetical protein G6F22_020014 [Rhizopus arrhizus]